MIPVQLEKDEWDRVMGIISQAPWNVANPLLMKIGQQLQPPDPLAVQRKLQVEAGTFLTEAEWRRINGGQPDV